MIVRSILICTIVLLLLYGNVESRKSSGRRSGGWGWGGSRSSSKTTPRPRSSQPYQTRHEQTSSQQGGSVPGKIGWNVPDSNHKQVNTAAKPSAPLPEQKSSATLQQSGYSPSGGYPRQSQAPSNPYGSQQHAYNTHNQPNQGYNPSVGQGYNPSVGQGYNPSVGQGFNPMYNPSSAGHAYNPMGGSPMAGGGYGAPFGGSPYGQMPQQTVLLQPSQSYKPGIGQLAKEAFVFAGVSAGVNAAVNRILPGGIYGHRESSGGSGSGAAVPVSHTQITYNNYYNNQSAPNPDGAAAPAAPVASAASPSSNTPAPPTVQPLEQPAQQQGQASNAQQPPATSEAKGEGQNAQKSQNAPNDANNNPNPLGFVISNEDIKKLSEEMFSKDKNNAFSHITVKLQGQKKDDSVTDDAPEPLLEVKPEAYEIPTIKAVLSLHDNYELDVKTKETVTSEKRKEESDLLDKFLETEVLTSAMKFLASKGYIEDDLYEYKDSLRRIWFSQFKRIDGEASSSGFETVYLAEKFDSDIIGLHNWIYYAKQEEEKKLNYLGYIKETKLGEKASILKVRSTLNDLVQPVTTIFVGTSPELEMALYTVCFFTRPNNVCPISLGGAEFIIVANRVNYFGKDILISAYPEI